MTHSPWTKNHPAPRRRALDADAACDVVIIGAGMAGLCTAYHLVREGLRVIVLDDGPVGGGETGRTTAHLVNALDDRYYNLAAHFGEEGARLAAQSHTLAIDAIEEVARDVPCELMRLDGYLFGDEDVLDKELVACRRAGLDVELVERVPWLSFDSGLALRFPRQAQMHPLLFLDGLLHHVERGGGRVFTGSHADIIEGGYPARVVANGCTVSAGAVVVATNTPVNDRFTVHLKQGAYRTYVIGIEVKGTAPHVLLWDTEVPYHYVRTAGDILMVGGEDHKVGQGKDGFGRLEQWARARFPCGDVLHRWSGQIMEPADGLAFIGHNPVDEDNVFIATGDSGNGMTHGMIAGILLTDMIVGRKNAWESLYDPRRLTLAVEPLVNLAQYAEWVAPHGSEAVLPGHGAVVRRGLSLVAVSCDEVGARRECAAVCPHLKGVVTFNETEQTWDCPVHGSRFTLAGRVLNGPANRGLGRVEERTDDVELTVK